MFYKTKSDETLQSIADDKGVPLDILIAFNQNLKPAVSLLRDEIIKIPSLADIPESAELTTGLLPQEIIVRARSAINKGTRYCLGFGGTKPSASLPYQAGTCKKTGITGNLCDCSGFVCWVLGLSRKTTIPFYQKYGGWIYTDSMEADVKSNAGIFEKIDVPEVGCIVVFGAGEKIGHVGIVSEVAGGTMKKVIHCGSGNDAKYKDAIQETPPNVFNRPDSVWGRYTAVVA
jgi:LysM repeat protein